MLSLLPGHAAHYVLRRARALQWNESLGAASSLCGGVHAARPLLSSSREDGEAKGCQHRAFDLDGPECGDSCAKLVQCVVAALPECYGEARINIK